MDAKPHIDVHWDDVRLLLAVARAASFLGAGRALGLATSTLSRRLARLEADVGRPLLERRNDGVRLTDAGRRLAETAERLEFDLRARLRELPADAEHLAGTIRVTAGDGFTDFLVGVIARFGEHHPDVRFELAIEARAFDIARREADLAVRTVHHRERSLVYRTLGTLSYGLFASPEYLDRRGLPRSLQALDRHAVLGFAAPLDQLPMMRWLAAQGVRRFAFCATTFGTLLAAARAGLGIAALPERLATELRPVLPRARPDPVTVYAVLHPDVRRLPHVRAFTESLVRSAHDLSRPARQQDD